MCVNTKRKEASGLLAAHKTVEIVDLSKCIRRDDAELLSSAELKSVRAGEGDDALDVDVIVIVILHNTPRRAPRAHTHIAS